MARLRGPAVQDGGELACHRHAGRPRHQRDRAGEDGVAPGLQPELAQHRLGAAALADLEQGKGASACGGRRNRLDIGLADHRPAGHGLVRRIDHRMRLLLQFALRQDAVEGPGPCRRALQPGIAALLVPEPAMCAGGPESRGGPCAGRGEVRARALFEQALGSGYPTLTPCRESADIGGEPDPSTRLPQACFRGAQGQGVVAHGEQPLGNLGTQHGRVERVGKSRGGDQAQGAAGAVAVLRQVPGRVLGRFLGRFLGQASLYLAVQQRIARKAGPGWIGLLLRRAGRPGSGHDRGIGLALRGTGKPATDGSRVRQVGPAMQPFAQGGPLRSVIAQIAVGQDLAKQAGVAQPARRTGGRIDAPGLLQGEDRTDTRRVGRIQRPREADRSVVPVIRALNGSPDPRHREGDLDGCCLPPCQGVLFRKHRNADGAGQNGGGSQDGLHRDRG